MFVHCTLHNACAHTLTHKLKHRILVQQQSILPTILFVTYSCRTQYISLPRRQLERLRSPWRPSIFANDRTSPVHYNRTTCSFLRSYLENRTIRVAYTSFMYYTHTLIKLYTFTYTSVVCRRIRRCPLTYLQWTRSVCYSNSIIRIMSKRPKKINLCTCTNRGWFLNVSIETRRRP